MIARPLSEIAAAVDGRIRGRDARIASVVTDSRRVVPGALFVALRGERDDGHAFVRRCVGARGRGRARATATGTAEPVLVVADTGRGLLALAADERDRMTGTTVVGITGANGKTSTKDLTAAVCGRGLPHAREPGLVQQRGRVCP